MSPCVSNKLSEIIWSHLESFEIIWSHLSHEATKLAGRKCTVLFLSVSTTDVGDSAVQRKKNENYNIQKREIPKTRS